MPYTSAIVTCNNLRTLAQTSIAVDKGFLTSVTALNMAIASEHMSTFGQVGLSKSLNLRNDIVAILAQGWIDGTTGINWTGKIALEPDMIIFLDARSSDGSDVKLSIITEH